MKNKNDKLKENLQSQSFRMIGECAISLLLAKLDMINLELSARLGRSSIQMKSGRMKSYESTRKKLGKKELEKNFSTALEKINDLVGVRAICTYIDDIYIIAETLEKHKDVRIIKVKDYIKTPKATGYRSLHIIMEVPVRFEEEEQRVKVELQLRTAAMDYWANLDHQLRYKKRTKKAVSVDEKLRQCAITIEELDKRMLEVRKQIETI